MEKRAARTTVPLGDLFVRPLKDKQMGVKGKEKKKDEFNSAMIWISFQPKKIQLSFLGLFSQWQLHSWITKLTIIALSKNIQSTPQYAVNKSWKISKNPGPKGNLAGWKFSRVKKFHPKRLKTAHSQSTVLFALSVRCNHTLAHVWIRGHVGDAKAPRSRDLQAKQWVSSGTRLLKT